ncbi:MAG: type II toxin-antitoxin system PemK/MazF family toxin [Spirochaetia bacterium]
MIDRYGIFWVNLDPVEGSEFAKKRPAVVVSDEEMNQVLRTVVVCPLTTRIHPQWPSRIQTEATGRPSEIAVDQIRTISRRRLAERIGSITETEAAALRHVITRMYGVLSVSTG